MISEFLLSIAYKLIKVPEGYHLVPAHISKNTGKRKASIPSDVEGVDTTLSAPSEILPGQISFDKEINK